MTDGQAKERPRAIPEFLIKATVKDRQFVSVGNVDQFAGFSNIAGDAASERNADLLTLKTLGNDGPQFFVLLIYQENGASISLHFGTRNAQDKFKQFG